MNFIRTETEKGWEVLYKIQHTDLKLENGMMTSVFCQRDTYLKTSEYASL